jgi:hypothetical protein
VKPPRPNQEKAAKKLLKIHAAAEKDRQSKDDSKKEKKGK